MLSSYPFLRVLRPYILLLGIPILIAAILFPVFGKARENARRSSCQSNLKQMMLAIKQYTKDYDEKFPVVAVSPVPKTPPKDSFSGPIVGWADAIQPYLKSTCIYQCPAETTTGSVNVIAGEGSYIDYWMNSRIASHKIVDAQLISLGDGDGTGDAQYAIAGLPANWQSVKGTKTWHGNIEPPWFERHLGGANYAFTDGHVKWLRPEQIGTADARFTP